MQPLTRSALQALEARLGGCLQATVGEVRRPDFRGDEYAVARRAAAADPLPDFRFVPVLSRPDAAWSGRTGHVQDAVAQDFGDLSEHALYLYADCTKPRCPHRKP